jgi:hypothetical protein
VKPDIAKDPSDQSFTRLIASGWKSVYNKAVDALISRNKKLLSQVTAIVKYLQESRKLFTLSDSRRAKLSKKFN